MSLNIWCVVLCQLILQGNITPTFASYADALEKIMIRLERLETENHAIRDENASLKERVAEIEEKYNALLHHMNDKLGEAEEKTDHDDMVSNSFQEENDGHSEVTLLSNNHIASPGRSKRSSPVQEIAFFATSSNDISNLGIYQVIIFDHVNYNLGNAYNSRHGFFQAPVDGTYVFHVTLACSQIRNIYGYLYANIYVNDLAMNEFLLPINTQAAHMLVYRLQSGDEVMVKNSNAGDSIYGHTYSAFSGFLLYAHGAANIVG